MVQRNERAMTTGLPFDDIRSLIREMPAGDEVAAQGMRARLERFAPAAGGHDRLHDMAIWLSRWSGKVPAIRKPLVAIFAGTHGAAVHDISISQAKDTATRVAACASGTATLNQVCAANDLGLQVYDLAVDLPTADMTADAALDEKACAATMAFGMEAVAGGVDLLCLGAFGVGDDVVAATQLAAIRGEPPRQWLTGARDEAMIERQISLATQALALHSPHRKSPLELLRRLGGRQFAAIAGAIVAARSQKVPVILDGVTAIAAAAVLQAMRGDAVEHCLLAQAAEGAGFQAIAASLFSLPPVFAGMISRDEGVSAALAAGVVRSAASLGSAVAGGGSAPRA